MAVESRNGRTYYYTSRRAGGRVASDLRAGLAGARPGPLDDLLAERVAVGWVFLHPCEGQYAAQLGKLNREESEFHTRRIEVARRGLLSACRTLAKVKRVKLPDVVALVNVVPAAGPPASGPAAGTAG